jgi:hypothetical protein
MRVDGVVIVFCSSTYLSDTESNQEMNIILIGTKRVKIEKPAAFLLLSESRSEEGGGNGRRCTGPPRRLE